MVDRDFYWIYIYIYLKKNVCIYMCMWDITNQYIDYDGNNWGLIGCNRVFTVFIGVDSGIARDLMERGRGFYWKF